MPSNRSRRNETLEDVTAIPVQLETNDPRWNLLICERDDLRKSLNTVNCKLLDMEAALKD